MADKSVGELIAAQSVTPTDLFVLEQNGTAKKLTGQVLENWLVSFADGHGGIQSIAKNSTNGLVDTYRITLADTTTFDFVVNNGRGINVIEKTGTEGLVDTYTIQFNDSTSSTFTVTHGVKGDKGDNQYVWIKYSSQKPTEASHSFGDVADNWIGIYSGASETAPTEWTEYEWFQIKGEKGDKGESATLTSFAVEYQAGDSGSVIPSGAWSTSVPVVAQGKYLWTRTTHNFNTGSPVVSYSVSRMGIDGSGSVSSVANISPDNNGNIPLTATDINALPSTGGDLTGELRMNGQKISGLNAPTSDDEPATKGYADNLKPDLTGYATENLVNQQVRKAAPQNLLDNSDFRNPVNQRSVETITPSEAAYTIDRWRLDSGKTLTVNNGSITIDGGWLTQFLEPGKIDTAKTYTAVLCDTNGDIHAETGMFLDKTRGSYWGFDITAGGIPFIGILKANSYRWAALYEGVYTADVLPMYQPKGYAAEFAECCRYAYAIGRYNMMSGFTTGSDKEIWTTVFSPAPMRINEPSFESYPNIVIRTVKGYSSLTPSTEKPITPINMLCNSQRVTNGQIFRIRFYFNSAIGSNNTPATVFFDSGCVISADL